VVEVDDADVQWISVHEDVVGRQVLVHHVLPVDPIEGPRDGDAQTEGLVDGKGGVASVSEHFRQGATEALHLQRDVSGSVGHQGSRTDHALPVQIPEEAMLPAQLGQIVGARVVGAERLQDDARSVRLLDGVVEHAPVGDPQLPPNGEARYLHAG
jgi:hypothetical protein